MIPDLGDAHRPLSACRDYKPAADRAGVVVTYLSVAPNNAHRHEAVTRMAIARRLAALKRYAFGGEYDAAERYSGTVFFVPSVTVVGIADAAAVGIRGEQNLFGGVVPHEFVATKSITHGLIDQNACAPDGWSHAFAHRVVDSVLKGFSAFSRDDALRAGTLLLQKGPIRIKRSLGIGGGGQFEVENPSDLPHILDEIDEHEIASCGVVIEENLERVTTLSVGQLRVENIVASYYGTQCSTCNNSGHSVYGGSELFVINGDFDALLEWPLSANARLAIAQARSYDAAASDCFDGLFASRRNYDIAQGFDARGEWRSGVLEQSWRLGGATGAEIAALEAFAADPSRRTVRAKTVEVYGPCEPPPSSVVYFRGVDEHVGPLTKYTIVLETGNGRDSNTYVHE